MPKHRGEKPAWQKRLASERIERLFELAEEDFSKKPENSRRYVKLARKIAMRYNIKLGSGLKRKFCRKCSAYLKYGTNSTRRIKKRVVLIRCWGCGNVERIPVKK